MGDRVTYVVARLGDDRASRDAPASSRSRPTFCMVGGGGTEVVDVEWYMERFKNPCVKVLGKFLDRAQCDAIFNPRNYSRDVSTAGGRKRITLSDRVPEGEEDRARRDAYEAQRRDAKKPRVQAKLTNFFNVASKE